MMKTLNHNILQLAEKHAGRLWTGRHVKDSISKISIFNNFSDHSSLDIKELGAEHVYAFMDHMKSLGRSDSTVNRYLAALSVIFDLATDLNIIEQPPKFKWLKEPKPRPRFFSQNEIEQLIKFFRHDQSTSFMADFVILGCQTGMRLGEILSINNRNSKVIGKISDCGNYVELSNTKNGDDRVVPLTDDAREALARLDNRPFFVHTHRRFYDAWKLARGHIAPGDKNFVFHVCRHTCATQLAMDHGVDAITIGLVLGHKSLATTKKYIKVKRDSLASVMKKLAA